MLLPKLCPKPVELAFIKKFDKWDDSVALAQQLPVGTHFLVSSSPWNGCWYVAAKVV